MINSFYWISFWMELTGPNFLLLTIQTKSFLRYVVPHETISQDAKLITETPPT